MRRRNIGSSRGYARGTGSQVVGPPPAASSVTNSFPQGQPSAAGHEINNPIKPGKPSPHRAGTLHLGGKGKMPKYNP